LKSTVVTVGGGERQVKIGGLGINLITSHTVVIYDRWFLPSLLKADLVSLFSIVLCCSLSILIQYIFLQLTDPTVNYSDWNNTHADLQTMARAHRLGQTKKVGVVFD